MSDAAIPMHPIRKIIAWTLEANTEPGFPRSGQQQWHALSGCGHKTNFGAGPKPSATEYRCASCPRE